MVSSPTKLLAAMTNLGLKNQKKVGTILRSPDSKIWIVCNLQLVESFESPFQHVASGIYQKPLDHVVIHAAARLMSTVKDDSNHQHAMQS